MVSQQNKAVPTILGLFCLLLIVQETQAREFIVGNSRWRVQNNYTESYNQWAEKTRFQKGDSLVFVYTKDQDSVLEVTKEAYDSCNTKAPLAKYTDGHSIVALNRTGPSYFISGEKKNCQNGEKLVVVVLADRNGNRYYNSSPPTSPPSTPSAPAPAPSGATADKYPTHPPPPPSAASSTLINVGFIGAFGTLAALLLSF